MTAPPGTVNTPDSNNQLAAAVLIQAFYTACAFRQQMGDNLTLERRQAIFEEVWRVWSETARALAAGKSTPGPQLYTPSSDLAPPAGREIT